MTEAAEMRDGGEGRGECGALRLTVKDAKKQACDAGDADKVTSTVE